MPSNDIKNAIAQASGMILRTMPHLHLDRDSLRHRSEATGKFTGSVATIAACSPHGAIRALTPSSTGYAECRSGVAALRGVYHRAALRAAPLAPCGLQLQFPLPLPERTQAQRREPDEA